jgi:uncharacterized protein (TIGR02996 family)
MSDEQALYRAIVAAPEDDTPRLVYADWLDEHDRPEEAEFIRLGCALEAQRPDHPDYPDWEQRHEELKSWLGTHEPRSAPRLAGGLALDDGPAWWQNSRRGFPRYLDYERTGWSGRRSMRALAAALEKAFDLLPTRWLVVRFLTTAQLDELLRQPVVERLEVLTLQLATDAEPQDEACRLIAACGRLRGLKGLLPAFDIGTAGAEALARSDNLTRLEWLDWSFSQLSPEGMRTLAAAPWFRNLKALGFDYGLAEDAFLELCRAEPLPRLHDLNLSNNDFSFRAWEAFSRSAAFPAVARLVLDHTSLAADATRLFQAPWFRPAYLSLNSCQIGDEEVAALAATPAAESLRSLRLRNNRLGARAALAIGQCRRLARLRHLQLSDNPLGSKGLLALARNPALRGLTALELDESWPVRGRLSDNFFREFLGRLDLPGLRHLALGSRPVGAEAARLLAGEKFRALRRLDLSECGLTDPVAHSLLTAPALQDLIELNLSGNDLGEGLRPLADPDVLPRLAVCALGGNRVAPDLARRLRRRPGVSI